jgi:hypothetical protein
VSFFVTPTRLADGLEAKNPPQTALLRPGFAAYLQNIGFPVPCHHGFGVKYLSKFNKMRDAKASKILIGRPGTAFLCCQTMGATPTAGFLPPKLDKKSRLGKILVCHKRE